MKNEELNAWLFENGGPVIRYRTATELLPQAKSPDIKRLAAEMLQSTQVRLWLERLLPPRLLNNSTTTQTVQASGINEIHNSKPTALENALAKLADFGINGVENTSAVYNEIVIKPNPATDYFDISFEKNDIIPPPHQIKIYNLHLYLYQKGRKCKLLSSIHHATPALPLLL